MENNLCQKETTQLDKFNSAHSAVSTAQNPRKYPTARTRSTLVLVLDKERLLRAPQLAIQAARVDELLVSALLGHLAAPQHDDEVRVVDCAQAMRDEDGGALLLLEDRVDVLEQPLLRVRVEGRRGFVEEEQRRVLEQETGDGEALFFTACGVELVGFGGGVGWGLLPEIIMPRSPTIVS